jgi:hypothetical protein
MVAPQEPAKFVSESAQAVSMTLDFLFQSTPARFESRLTAVAPPSRLDRRTWVLLGLLLLCLVPRGIMAWKLHGLCPDAVLYIQIGEAWDHGQLEEGLKPVRLNLFPFVLTAMHHAGLPWELAGKLWGVLISSLTVLPLYGWARRQFDDRVALAACFLYAVHWELIRWSPEIIRDPTFWFLFTLSLYLMWRAVTEVRLWFFLAAGVAMSLAALTRFEGMFLVVPLVFWSATRCWTIARQRGRLLLGTLLCVGFFPALLTLLTLVWLRHHTPSDLLRLAPLTWVHQWLRASVGLPLNAAALSSTPAGAGSTISLTRMIGIFVPNMVKGLTLLFGVLLLGGIARWRRTWRQPEHQAILLLAIVICLATWIHLWVAHGSCRRYFLPLVITGSPFAGLTLLELSGVALRYAVRRRRSLRAAAAWAAAPIAAVGLVGLTLALSTDCSFRTAQVSMGRWVQKQFGPAATLLGPEGVTQVVGYYAGARPESFPWTSNSELVAGMVRDFQPDVVLLPNVRGTAENRASMVEAIKQLGFAPVDLQQFPGGGRNVVLLGRAGAARSGTPAHPVYRGARLLRGVTTPSDYDSFWQ